MTKFQPMQPIELDAKGVVRFRGNAIVRHLLEHGGIDLNMLARLEFSQEDREQLAQLIGYSVSGFGDLSYASAATVSVADAAAASLLGNEPASAAQSEGYRQGFKDGRARGIEDAKQALQELDAS